MTDPIKYAEQIAYSSKEVLHFTYDNAVRLRDTPGVYVECGVAAGAQIIAMAHGAPNKTIYAFDSFEGIPLPSNRDNQMPGIAFLKEWEQKALPDPGKQELKSSGATVVKHGDYLENLHLSGIDMSKCYSTIGWFENTLPEVDYIDEIALLRLDGDLYNSTLVCLQYLYPKVVKGGMVIVDDWALPGCKAAVMDYFGMSLPEMQFIYGKDYAIAHWTRKHKSRSAE